MSSLGNVVVDGKFINLDEASIIHLRELLNNMNNKQIETKKELDKIIEKLS